MSAHVTRLDRARPVQQRSVETRERILDAARMLLAEVGRDRFTTGDVAACAGVAIGTLYRYFAHRADLIKAVLERDEVYVAQLKVLRAAAAVAARPRDQQCVAALTRSTQALVDALAIVASRPHWSHSRECGLSAVP